MLDKTITQDPSINELIIQSDYAEAAKQLLATQKKSWKQLADGYASLENIKIKNFQYDGFRIKTQFNLGRYISTSAKVDQKSINERKCFLCPVNLPEDQKAILYKKEFLILCNPFPIFPEHFTIPNVNHVPQKIEGNFPLMLDLTKDLAKHYVVLYNGPKCGASAPDHFHFQAGTKNYMPINDDLHQLQNEYGELLFENDELIVSAIDDGLRKIIAFESLNNENLIEAFNKFYKIYSSAIESDEEPLMNIISSYEEDFGWIVIVFLREKHRSSHYFTEGENKILLSPASVDLGGVCITPLEKDFKRMNKELLTEILSEVSLNKNTFNLIEQRIKQTYQSA